MAWVSKCERCGVERDYPFPSKVRRFCSHACSNQEKWERREKSEIKTLKCLKCERDFSLKSYVAGKRADNKSVFCSRACYQSYCSEKSSDIRTECGSCGSPFMIKARYKKSVNYCSAKCLGLSRRKSGPWSESDVDLEARRAYFRKYTEKNRDKINESSRAYGKRNKAAKLEYQRVARSAGALSRIQKDEIIEKSPFCAHCARTDRLEIDHIIPVSLGGKTEASNLQVLCRACNASKGKRERPLMPKSALSVT